jgi:hypothetical protein
VEFCGWPRIVRQPCGACLQCSHRSKLEWASFFEIEFAFQSIQPQELWVPAQRHSQCTDVVSALNAWAHDAVCSAVVPWPRMGVPLAIHPAPAFDVHSSGEICTG